MKEPPVPETENHRLAVLGSMGVLYSPAEERFDRITRLARQVLSMPISLISLVAQDVQWFKSRQGLGVPETPRRVSFCAHAILESKLFIINDAREHEDFKDNPLVTGEPFVRFYAGQPLEIDGEKIGTLCVIDTEPREFMPSECETLAALGSWVESELRLQSLVSNQQHLIDEMDEVRRAALLDPLTQVWNRRGLEQMLAVEINRSQRNETPATVMLVDLDKFKEVNDTYGHPVGDVALSEAAQMLTASVRPQDIVCRYGGDEFLLLLGNCCEQTARAISDRVFKLFNERAIRIENQKSLNLSVSIGAASNDFLDEVVYRNLLSFADRAVYEAKSRGRNQAVFHNMSNATEST